MKDVGVQIYQKDSGLWVTSLDVAKCFNKEHRHVLQNIRTFIDKKPEFSLPNFRQRSYKNSRGQKYPLFEMTKDGFYFLTMGFTGDEASDWKIKFIDAFNKMEEALKSMISGKELPPHTQLVVQLQKSKDVNAKYYTEGCGSNQLIIWYNTNSMKDLTGKYPKYWKMLAKKKGHKNIKSGKDGLRAIHPGLACAKSFQDDLVTDGYQIDDATRIAIKSEEIFNDLIAIGKRPAELNR